MEYSINPTDAVDQTAPKDVIECLFRDAINNAINSNPHLDDIILD